MQLRALRRLIFALVLTALGLAATPQTAPGQGTALQPRAAAHARRQRPQLSLGAEPALCRAGFARRLPLGLRRARQRHASAGARQAGRLGARGHVAQLSLAHLSQSLHHRHRSLSRAPRPGRQQLLRSRARRALLHVRSADRDRRLLVQRRALVEPGREPGHAHGVPSLGRLRSQDRRLPALVLRRLRRQNRVHAEGRSRRASTMQSPCCACPPPIARTSSPSTTPSPTTRATSSVPMRAKPGSRAQDGRSRGQAESRARGHRPAHRSGGRQRSRHGEVRGRLDRPRPIRRSRRIRCRWRPLYGKTEEDRARVYNQLKKASSQFVVYRRKDVPAGLQLQRESARRRPGGGGHWALRDSRPRSAGRASPIARRPSACTASIRT